MDTQEFIHHIQVGNHGAVVSSAINILGVVGTMAAQATEAPMHELPNRPSLRSRVDDVIRLTIMPSIEKGKVVNYVGSPIGTFSLAMAALDCGIREEFEGTPGIADYEAHVSDMLGDAFELDALVCKRAIEILHLKRLPTMVSSG